MLIQFFKFTCSLQLTPDFETITFTSKNSSETEGETPDDIEKPEAVGP